MPVQLGSAFGKIEIDFSGVKRGVDAASKELATFESTTRRIGQNLKSVGDQLSLSVTAPLVAVGVAAGRMGMEFEESMQQIVGLVGVSQDQVNAWADDLLALGPQLGKAPEELAKSLYFITSSGLQGSEALDALEQSARAASAGLGETQIVADAVTSAMNAYSTSNLSAAEATDILVATVREGKGEADTIAPALGRVIPVAAQLGVSFEEVGAAMAGMTLVGFDAAEAATNLSGILSAFIKPSKQASEELAKFGLSGDQVRQMLDERGLLATLTLLRDTIGQDDEALAKIYPNVRGFRGALALVGENAEQVQGIFSRMANTTGDADKAFQAASQTAKFQFSAAMAGIQSSLVKLSDALLPVVIPILKSLAETIQNITRWFSTLDQGTQQTIVQLLALTAALGPVLSIGGRLIGVVGSVVSLFTSLGGALATAAKMAGSFAKTGFEVVQYLVEAGTAGLAAAAAFAAIAAALVVMIKFFDAASRAAAATNEELIKMANSDTGNVIEDTFNRAGASFELMANGSKRLKDVFVAHQEEMRKKLLAGEVTLEAYNEEIERSAKVAGVWKTSMTGMGRTTDVVDESVKILTEDQVRLSRQMVEANAQHQQTVRSLKERDAAQMQATDSTQALGAATQAAIDDANAFAEAQKKTAEDTAAAGAQMDQLRALIDGPVGAAYENFKGKQDDLKTQMGDVSAALDENAAAWDEHLKRILFDIATEQLAVDGLTSTEVTALTTIAEKWGLIDSATAEATRAVLSATGQLAEDGNAQVFADNMQIALDQTKIAAETTQQVVFDAVGSIGESYARAGQAASASAAVVSTATQTVNASYALTAEGVNTQTTAIATDTQTMTEAVATAAGGVPGALQPIKDEFSDAAKVIAEKVRNIIEAINNMIKKIMGIKNITVPEPGSGTAAPAGRAHGGSLFPGMAYAINESALTRPEIIMPQTPGYALTRQNAAAALRDAAALSSAQARTENIYVTIPVGQVSNEIDMELLAYRVADRIARRR